MRELVEEVEPRRRVLDLDRVEVELGREPADPVHRPVPDTSLSAPEGMHRDRQTALIVNRIHGRGCGHARSDPALDEQADDVAVTAGDFLTDDNLQPRRRTRGVVGGPQRTFDRVVIGDCDHVESCCARVIDQLLR